MKLLVRLSKECWAVLEGCQCGAEKPAPKNPPNSGWMSLPQMPAKLTRTTASVARTTRGVGTVTSSIFCAGQGNYMSHNHRDRGIAEGEQGCWGGRGYCANSAKGPSCAFGPIAIRCCLLRSAMRATHLQPGERERLHLSWERLQQAGHRTSGGLRSASSRVAAANIISR